MHRKSCLIPIVNPYSNKFNPRLYQSVRWDYKLGDLSQFDISCWGDVIYKMHKLLQGFFFLQFWEGAPCRAFEIGKISAVN